MDIKTHYNLMLMDDGSSIIALDHNSSLEEQTIPGHYGLLDWHKRFRYKVGDKVVNPWGIIETIKEVIHHEETHTTNYLVEENGNCYLPRELNGIYIKSLSPEETAKLIEK